MKTLLLLFAILVTALALVVSYWAGGIMATAIMVVSILATLVIFRAGDYYER